MNISIIVEPWNGYDLWLEHFIEMILLNIESQMSWNRWRYMCSLISYELWLKEEVLSSKMEFDSRHGEKDCPVFLFSENFKVVRFGQRICYNAERLTILNKKQSQTLHCLPEIPKNLILQPHCYDLIYLFRNCNSINNNSLIREFSSHM